MGLPPAMPCQGVQGVGSGRVYLFPLVGMLIRHLGYSQCGPGVDPAQGVNIEQPRMRTIRGLQSAAIVLHRIY